MHTHTYICMYVCIFCLNFFQIKIKKIDNIISKKKHHEYAYGICLASSTRCILCAYGQKRILYKRIFPGTRGGSTDPKKKELRNFVMNCSQLTAIYYAQSIEYKYKYFSFTGTQVSCSHFDSRY